MISRIDPHPQAGTRPPLRVRLFGPFEVSIHDRPLPRLRSRKSQWLLALLVLRRGAGVERDWLAGLLWSERTDRQMLRNSLSDLRRALGAEAARLRAPTAHTLSLDLSGAEVDLVAFDAAIARADAASLAEAAALYRGPLLEGCAEEWVFQERQVREQAYLTALERLAAHAAADGDPAAAEGHLRRAAATDPLRESTQRSLMQALAAGGNYASALVTYRELRLRLHREINAEPDPKTSALFARLRAEAREKAGTRSTRSAATRAVSGCIVGSESAPLTGRPRGSLATAGSGNGSNGHAALTSPDPYSHNLPLQLTRFIGREAEIARLCAQLTPGDEERAIGNERPTPPPASSLAPPSCRLATLTGAGGCGKTRLALEVAAGLLGAYPDGVWFVELAPLADPALMPETVADALAIREQPGRRLIDTLVEALKPKQLLLVLDNCEHLVGACAELAQALLRACPHLRILATSREPLRIPGEQPYRVPSLSLPPSVDGQWLMVEGPADTGRPLPSTISHQPSALLQSEAIRLFVERAVTVQPGFALTASNAAAVVQVCCRLDGIPLAIELAAARLQALPVEELGQRLSDTFGLLTGGSRTALPRHQTLRALIDWSHALLTPSEQALLRRLSVFAGGCTLEAAGAVCGCAGVRGQGSGVSPTQATLSELTPDPWSLTPDVLDLLTRLVEKSLVLYEQRAGEGRYRLLEMIREYARERLAASGETEVLRERHARCFLALAETAEPELAGPDQGRWLDRLEREHDNLRAALGWSLEAAGTTRHADTWLSAVSEDEPPVTDSRRPMAESPLELGLRLGSALEGFWPPRGHLREGRTHLLRLLAERGAAVPATVRARSLSTAGVLTSLQADQKSAQALFEESLAIWRRLDDRASIATVLSHLGWLAANRWDLPAARPLVEECLAIRRELGEPRGLADALALLARVCQRTGDPAETPLLEGSIAIWRALGDRVSAMGGLSSLARAAMCEDDMDTARRLYQEVLATATELSDKPRVAWAIFGLGEVAHDQQDYAAARLLFEQCLPLWRGLEEKQGLIQTLLYLETSLKRLGDGTAAYARFAEALALSREGNRSNCLVAVCLGLLGNTAGDLGQWEETAACCAESLRLSPSAEYGQYRLSMEWALIGMARVAATHGRPARAARLLGAAEAVCLLDGPVPTRWRYELDRAAAPVPAQMEAAELEAAWAAGKSTPLEQIIAEALEEGPAV